MDNSVKPSDLAQALIGTEQDLADVAKMRTVDFARQHFELEKDFWAEHQPDAPQQTIQTLRARDPEYFLTYTWNAAIKECTGVLPRVRHPDAELVNANNAEAELVMRIVENWQHTYRLDLESMGLVQAYALAVLQQKSVKKRVRKIVSRLLDECMEYPVQQQLLTTVGDLGVDPDFTLIKRAMPNVHQVIHAAKKELSQLIAHG